MAKISDDGSFDEDVFINLEDGMPNSHPNLKDISVELDNVDNVDKENDFDDLPKSIIVTNIHSQVFNDEKLKTELEDLFRTFSNNASFQWLRSFRRLRVNYENPVAAANARIKLHQYPFYNNHISCYFAQPVTPISIINLKPPAPVKQFLISPPASPPVGWEPREEGEPLVNHDLLAALANLSPGESHEVHAPTATQPAIIIHTALGTESQPHLTCKIPQTRCPD